MQIIPQTLSIINLSGTIDLDLAHKIITEIFRKKSSCLERLKKIDF